MKDFKIGSKTYQLLEDVYDINDKRFNHFKMYLLKSLEGIDRPLYSETLQKGIEFFNNHKYIQGLSMFQNYGQAIEHDGYNEDALSKCFALICLEYGEDQLNTDENFLNRKLDDMWSNGLTRGVVEECVRNFTIASPTSFGGYSLKLAEMTQNLGPEFWSALEGLQNGQVSPKVSQD
jgi:hypothetical protein